MELAFRTGTGVLSIQVVAVAVVVAAAAAVAVVVVAVVVVVVVVVLLCISRGSHWIVAVKVMVVSDGMVCIRSLVLPKCTMHGANYCSDRFSSRTFRPTLHASPSGTFLLTLPELVTPLKGNTLSLRICPPTRSAPCERFGY